MNRILYHPFVIVFSLVLGGFIFYPGTIPAQSQTNASSTYEQAREHYRNDNPQKARPLLQNIIENQSDSSTRRKAHYLLGNILKNREQQPINAMKHLDKVVQGANDNLTDDSLFFIANILIDQMDQPGMALAYLKTIITHFPESDYYDRAQQKLDNYTENRERPVKAFDKNDIPPPRVQLNFEKVDLQDFVSAYSKMTNKNFIYKPNISGKVTILAPQGFPIYDLFDVFLNVLETRNYTAIQKKDHYLIKQNKQAFRDGVGREKKQSGLRTQLYTLDGLPWQDVKRIIKQMIPRRKNLLRLKRFDQMLVTTTPQDHKEIESLLSDLKSVDESAIVQYQPQHLRVDRLANRLKSFLQSILDQRSFTTVPLQNNNTLIVRLPDTRKKMVLRTLRQFDGDMVDRLNMDVITLEHASAQKITNKLQQLTNVLPGNFSDRNIEVVPSQRQNAVIVSSTSEKALDIIRKSVEDLDKPSPQKPKQVKIFPLKHTQPEQMAQQLNQLSNLLPGDFPQKNVQILPSEQQRAVIISAGNKKVFPRLKKIVDRLDRENKDAPETIRTFQLDNANEERIVEKLRKLVKTLPSSISEDDLTILPDKRQKAVIVSAQTTKTLSLMERVIQDLDRKSTTDSSDFHVYKVHNAQAGPLAEKLNFLTKDDVGEPIKITADEQSNSLVISAPADKFETLKPIIQRLDSSKKQILVDAYIVEASRDNVQRLGVEWTATGEVNDQEVSAGTNYGLRPQFQEGSLLGLSTGIFNEGGSELVGMLSAFSERSGFKILSTSHLVANENEEANLSVGSIVPILEDSQVTSEGSINRSFSFENVGVDLSMTPTLSGDSEVTLSLEQKIQELENTGQELGAPTRRNREINTRLSITENKTLVLGGVMSSQSNRNRQSVPYLSQVPGLNYLFSNINNEKQRRNLLIFIQPHILGDDEEAQEVTEELRNEQENRLDSDTGVSLDNFEKILKEDTKPNNISNYDTSTE